MFNLRLFCFNHLSEHLLRQHQKRAKNGFLMPASNLGRTFSTARHGGSGSLSHGEIAKLQMWVRLLLAAIEPVWESRVIFGLAWIQSTGIVVRSCKLRTAGVHIPVKKLNSGKLLSALVNIQTDEVKQNVARIGEQIRNENGLENAVREIEGYFGATAAHAANSSPNARQPL